MKQQDNVGRTENLYPCTAEAIAVRDSDFEGKGLYTGRTL